MKIYALFLAALIAAFPTAAVTLAPAVEIHDATPPAYSTAPFDRRAESLPAHYAGQNPVELYNRLAGGDAAPVDVFAFTVDLAAQAGNPVLGYDAKRGMLTMRYVMTGNHVTEGWNWDAHANPQTSDFYPYKFLPLWDVTSEKAPGQVWKFEYMVSFANLYDFYPRSSDDDAGFSAAIAMPTAAAFPLMQGNLRMLAVCRLAAPWHKESNTFWKATDSAPYDYTLRKRYVFTDLLEVWFYDYRDGNVLARLKPRS